MREKQTSDVNLLMSSNTNEERNQEIVQKFKEMLHKKIDLKNINEPNTNTNYYTKH